MVVFVVIDSHLPFGTAQGILRITASQVLSNHPIPREFMYVQAQPELCIGDCIS